ncbi:UNVERIFIED_CONTAM: hypothetical protein Slati_2222600 [Sesamum latifolium]|uniref:Uncharacterized protein n=1 Tax=Sesamum latifolium TaxID=2727402 RepID=A0AAW2WT95_9LAMI
MGWLVDGVLLVLWGVQSVWKTHVYSICRMVERRATLTATDSFSPRIIPIVGTRKHSLRTELKVEASIVEAYLVEEISLFTSQYFEPQVLCKWNRPSRNDDLAMNDTRIQQSILNFPGRGSGASKKRWLSESE